VLYNDLTQKALPKVMQIARNRDKIVVTTHLITEKSTKKLPHSPTIESAFPYDRVFVIITAVLADIIRSVVYKRKQKTDVKLISKKLYHQIKRIIRISCRKSYRIVWIK